MFLLALPVITLPSASLAADALLEPLPAMPPTAGWTFTLAPYFWMAGIEGSIAQFGFDALEVDASFMDVMENFDIGAMAVAEARNGPFGIAMDFQYIRLSAEVETPLGLLADRIAVESTTLTALVAGEYRILETGTTSVDLMAGARLWRVETDIDPRGGPANDLFFSDGDTWVDPIIGARARQDLAGNIYLTGWGMIGGFGAASDFTWDVMAALGYQLNDRISMVGGYRALGVDYSDGDFLFDVVQHGPILGAVLRF
jgi:hypothetical protein